ncbi:MAG: transcriptional regulator with XRE-family HTH domain/predicted transcriptional regulator [bacterium]|jgi:transcriptional regulator with XRE-family HTH domain/predicted transcriptional regulator
MELDSQSIKFIFGIKLRRYRKKKNYSLKELSKETGLSASYLNEIEKGKKYPKTEKILTLSKSLDVTFDDLVSLNLGTDLQQISSLFDSSFLRRFPFQLFGITTQNILELMSNAPTQAGALLRSLFSIARSYDMKVEHFFSAALSSYQEMHNNYFEDIEQASIEFIQEQGWENKQQIQTAEFQSILENQYNYQIQETDFNKYPQLKVVRTVWVEGEKPKLLINSKLMNSQKDFVLAREIAYNRMGLKERVSPATWNRVESFDPILNNFKASYFAGAIFIRLNSIQKHLAAFFQNQQWDEFRFLELIHQYNVTPEMFMYRVSQVLYKFFQLKEIIFLRVNHNHNSRKFRLNRELNMSGGSWGRGVGLNEHLCRRWLPLQLIQNLEQSIEEPPLIGIQRAKVLSTGSEFLFITLSRPLVLVKDSSTSVTLGLEITPKLKRKIRFWNDKNIPRINIDETCERCPLNEEQCSQRAAPSTVFQREQDIVERNTELQALIQEMKAND